MDLRGWRHHISDRTRLESAGPLTFVSRDTSSQTFPRVTRRQIVRAVEAESRKWDAQGYREGDRWVRPAGRCTTATTHPCGVSVSEVRLRIRMMDKGGWKTIQIVEMMIPMGC